MADCFFKLMIVLSISLFAPVSVSYAGGDPVNGEKLFKSKGCSKCHKLTLKKKVGPGLKGATTRHSAGWLRSWLTNPQKKWEENDIETQILKKWAPGRMDARKTRMKIKKLTEQEITDLIQFLRKNDEY